MNPEPGKRPETHIADFSDILCPPDGDEPPVIVGGHAVNLWATYFLSHGEDALSKYLPFTSKDLDLVGTWDLLERLHQRLKGTLARSDVPRESADLLGEVAHDVRTLGEPQPEVTPAFLSGEVSHLLLEKREQALGAHGVAHVADEDYAGQTFLPWTLGTWSAEQIRPPGGGSHTSLELGQLFEGDSATLIDRRSQSISGPPKIFVVSEWISARSHRQLAERPHSTAAWRRRKMVVCRSAHPAAAWGD